MAYTEEASKFDAQKNKLKSLCEEHDLVYSLNVETGHRPECKDCVDFQSHCPVHEGGRRHVHHR